MATVGVSFRTEPEDVDKLDDIALYIFRQNRAGALRLLLLEAIEKYSDQVEEKKRLKQKQPAVVAPAEQTVTVPKENKPKPEPAVIQANYETTENWGPPKTCPVCGSEKSSDGLDQPALAVVKSGTDWGCWACHECYSSGRWFDTQPFIILEDTQKAEELPISQDDE